MEWGDPLETVLEAVWPSRHGVDAPGVARVVVRLVDDMRYITGSRIVKLGLARSILARSVRAARGRLARRHLRGRGRSLSAGSRSRKGLVAGTPMLPRRLATSSAGRSQTYASPFWISSSAQAYMRSK
jgi:hypothetical protein